jgi:hypothetical protein
MTTSTDAVTMSGNGGTAGRPRPVPSGRAERDNAEHELGQQHRQRRPG